MTSGSGVCFVGVAGLVLSMLVTVSLRFLLYPLNKDLLLFFILKISVQETLKIRLREIRCSVCFFLPGIVEVSFGLICLGLLSWHPY